MTEISYSGYRFPSEIIQQAIWLYLRFTLSFRDVEDLLAETRIVVSYETVAWVNHFGPKIATDLRKRRPKPQLSGISHLDEVYLKIDGRLVYLWRAVDARAKFLMCWSNQTQQAGGAQIDAQAAEEIWLCPDKLVTDDLRSYGAAADDLGIAKRHERSRWLNNRAENSHQPPDEGREKCKVQERGIRAKISLSACSNTKYFRRPAPSHLSKNAPSLPESACRRGVKSSLPREPDVPGDCYALYLAT